MIEQEVTVTVTKTTIRTLDDVIDLLRWAQGRDGLYATVSAQCDGPIYIEVGGTTVDTKQAKLGDTIIWDGTRFEVISSI